MSRYSRNYWRRLAAQPAIGSTISDETLAAANRKYALPTGGVSLTNKEWVMVLHTNAKTSAELRAELYDVLTARAVAHDMAASLAVSVISRRVSQERAIETRDIRDLISDIVIDTE